MSKKSERQFMKDNLRIEIKNGSGTRVAKIGFSRVEKIHKSYSVDSLDTRQAEHLFHLMANAERIHAKYSAETGRHATFLLWDEQIAKIARGFSRDMSTSKAFNLALSDGTAMQSRLSKAGIKWSSFGVNLGISSGYALAAHMAFMREQPHRRNHRANILNPRFTRFGAGVILSRGVFYVCEIFLEPTEK